MQTDEGRGGTRRSRGRADAQQVDLQTWSAALGAAIARTGKQSTQFATTGMTTKTINNHLNRRVVPTLESIAYWASVTDYGVLDQVRDLLGLPQEPAPEPAVSGSGLGGWAPPLNQQQLLSRLHRVLADVGAATPTAAEMAQTVLRSCADSRDPGRWRTVLFDVQGGWHFPHVAFNVVEFHRWYGPFRRAAQDPDPELGTRFLRQAMTQRERGYVVMPRHLFEAQPSERFLLYGAPRQPIEQDVSGYPKPAEVSAEVKQAWWDRHRRERAELGIRLEHTRFAARGEWEGTNGRLVVPLVGGAKQARDEGVAPRPRHLWIEPAALPVPGSHGFVPSLAEPGGHNRTSTLVVVSAVGVNAARTIDVFAQGIGWEAASLRDLIQRNTGWRVLVEEEVTEKGTRQVLGQIAADPPPHTVVWINLQYLLVKRGQHCVLLPEIVEALNQPTVQSLLIDSRTPRNYELWEERFKPPGTDLDSRAPSATTSMELVDQWVDETSDAVPGQVRAVLNPVYPWAGPSVYRPGSYAPAWYRHPLVGDIGLRAAYEMAAYFLNTPSGRPPSFVPESLLHRHQGALLAAHRKRPLYNDADLEALDERFQDAPPDGSHAPRGSVLSFSAIRSRPRLGLRLPALSGGALGSRRKHTQA